MNLDGGQRRTLRLAMLGAFTQGDLDLFLQDHLDVALPNIVPLDAFNMQCQQVILWAEREGQITKFLQAIVADHGNPALKTLASQLLAPASAAGGGNGGPARPFQVSQRPVLDRKTFWKCLSDLADGGGENKVLAVSGGVGKSYSRWPVSHVCDPAKNVARMVRVEANEGKVVQVDGARLANLIATRLWGDERLADPEDLAQAARVTRNSATQLIQRFGALAESTWLIVDELNLVNLDDTAIDLLGKLAEAVDDGQCPNLRLFLFGFDPDKLGPRVGPYVAVDLVNRPGREDIEEYLTRFAEWVGRPQNSAALKGIVDALDNLLPPAPQHSDWESFHTTLKGKCKGIAEGSLP